MESQDSWISRTRECLAEYDAGEIDLGVLSERILAYANEGTAGRGELFEAVRELTDELERHHDLRTSPWNSPEDVGPEDEQDLSETVARVRDLVS
ncbi:hypothetical protein OG478_22155 [Streptomyces phaeochromogenes]|uniref:Uncharacterized protein n=1 Tax=Streptomyces phaeochromogenes TaxID=1923 RepID=A0ABZ1HCB2_STRPH|nr:hypothetical protein [Streptomyces phaeochromogenes]WRZ30037.1 hypothetical protein OG931_20940 [Streptomyces phaeochromogenes]WSD15714.1 hypothetical protein OHB35_22045 [Streptomyces phaeochromogenes]WSS94241.1 hypothetical protein OG478_22155 [Streptomyces phaeochromogenes]